MNKYSIWMVFFGLVLSGCFMETAVPLSPVDEASYPADIIDTWVMTHNKNAIFVIEKENDNELRITTPDKTGNKANDSISTGHISSVYGKIYFNEKPLGKDRYNLYQFERPCPDLILIYLPNPEVIDGDISSGRVKGKIKQDFFTFRIIEEDQQDLINYINSRGGELFVPFRYMVRASKKESLSAACKSSMKPLPIDNQQQRK